MGDPTIFINRNGMGSYITPVTKNGNRISLEHVCKVILNMSFDSLGFHDPIPSVRTEISRVSFTLSDPIGTRFLKPKDFLLQKSFIILSNKVFFQNTGCGRRQKLEFFVFLQYEQGDVFSF